MQRNHLGDRLLMNGTAMFSSCRQVDGRKSVANDGIACRLELHIGHVHGHLYD